MATTAKIAKDLKTEDRKDLGKAKFKSRAATAAGAAGGRVVFCASSRCAGCVSASSR